MIIGTWFNKCTTGELFYIKINIRCYSTFNYVTGKNTLCTIILYLQIITLFFLHSLNHAMKFPPLNTLFPVLSYCKYNNVNNQAIGNNIDIKCK